MNFYAKENYRKGLYRTVGINNSHPSNR